MLESRCVKNVRWLKLEIIAIGTLRAISETSELAVSIRNNDLEVKNTTDLDDTSDTKSLIRLTYVDNCQSEATYVYNPQDFHNVYRVANVNESSHFFKNFVISRCTSTTTQIKEWTSLQRE